MTGPQALRFFALGVPFYLIAAALLFWGLYMIIANLFPIDGYGIFAGVACLVVAVLPAFLGGVLGGANKLAGRK